MTHSSTMHAVDALIGPQGWPDPDCMTLSAELYSAGILYVMFADGDNDWIHYNVSAVYSSLPD